MSAPSYEEGYRGTFSRPTAVQNVFAGVFCIYLVLVSVHYMGIRKIPYMQPVIDKAVIPLRRFAQDSWRFFNRCSKPTHKEFSKVCCATAVGFSIMGLIGFFVKLVHIPINNILVTPH